jgi:hypothetical protein
MKLVLSQFNLLKPIDNYHYYYLPADLTVSNSVFLIYVLSIILTVNRIISFNIVTKSIFVMVKCGVLFEVRTEFSNNI